MQRRGQEGRPSTGEVMGYHDSGPESPRRPRYTFKASPAVRSSIFLRAGICGAGGSGKTYSALAIACALAERLGLGEPYVIDSEHGSALRYAHSPRSLRGFKFQHVPMPDGDYSPEAYMAAFQYVMAEGARVVLIDSISHEWDGANGCLEMVDKIADAAEKRGRKPDNFSAWREVTPLHRAFLESMLSMQAHVLFTVRAKTKYKSGKDQNGRMKFEKDGEGPVQREGIEYEPDLWFWMADAVLTVDKTRCDRLAPGSVHERPGAEFAGILADWIEDVEPTAPKFIPRPDARPSQPSDDVIGARLTAALEQARNSNDAKRARLDLVAWLRDNGVPRDPTGARVLAEYDRLTREPEPGDASEGVEA